MHVVARFPGRVVRNGDYSSHSASIAAGIYPDNGWGLNWSILMLWKARHDFLGMVCSCPQRRGLRHFSRSFSSGEGPFVSPCLLYTSPSPRDGLLSRMPSSA